VPSGWQPSAAAPAAGTRVLPALVAPEQPGQPLLATPALCAHIDEQLRASGAVLLRGFSLHGQEGQDGQERLRAFASAFGHPLLGHELSAIPRTALGAGVYTTAEYPAHRSMPLLNELSHTRAWPMKLWLFCEQAALSGGATPLADCRRIYQRMPALLRERFASQGLSYVRNYGGGLDVDWSRVFGTAQRAEVERICLRRGIEYEWFGRQQLRTRERAQAVAKHPRTGEWVWFNQAHLFHLSALPADERAALLDVCGYERLPRHVYFGDGSPIDDGMLEEIRAVMDAERVMFPMLTGDVLMLDNMLVAHGREPFSGPRRVLLAMAERHGE
jgi:alpha-ketoglutarate-dependent taurine dioxygenase